MASDISESLANVIRMLESAIRAAGVTCLFATPMIGPCDFAPRAAANPYTATLPLQSSIIEYGKDFLIYTLAELMGGQHDITPLERVVEHFEYLREVSQPNNQLISPETASIAGRVWFECWSATGFALPVPAACTGPDGQMLYTWDTITHHLELELDPREATGTFFYRNRATGDTWIEDYKPGDAIHPEAIQKLKLFV